MSYNDNNRIETNMNLINKGNLLAIGDVTIDGCFTINNVRVRRIADKNGNEKDVVFLPDKKLNNGQWESVFSVQGELYNEINTAVLTDVRNLMVSCITNNVYFSDLSVSIRPFVDKDLLGYASLTYKDDFTVSNIRIKKDRNAYGISLEFPFSFENGRSHNLFEINDDSARYAITRLISDAYQDMVRQPEEKKNHNQMPKQKHEKGGITR